MNVQNLYKEITGNTPPQHIKFPWKWFFKGDGFTLGPIIFVRPNEPEVYIHEMVHVEQFYRQPLTFWFKYFKAHFNYGYGDNPYEKEAYEVQYKAYELMYKE